MKTKNLYVAIDIGTTKVCTAIAEKTPTGHKLIGVGNSPSSGLKKGSVVNIEQTVTSINSSLAEAKLMAGLVDIDSVVIGISGNHIFSFNSSGVVLVKSHSITEEDISRAVEAAKAVLIPSEREVLHVIAQEFKVDNISGVKNPVGMCGSRLEVKVHIVTGKKTLIQNLIKCVEMTGVSVSEVILQPLASSQSVLSVEEMDMGVVLVDIGGGTTDIAVWKEGSLIFSQVIPIGGQHFTNDLAVGLKIPHSEAEKIKLSHGTVINLANESERWVGVQGIPGTKEKQIDKDFIISIMRARAEELFSLVQSVLNEVDAFSEINGGIVITGGGALIKNICQFAEFSLERPVKIGYPLNAEGMTRVMQNPKFSTVLGLLSQSKSLTNCSYNEEEHFKISSKKTELNIGKSLKSFFKDLF